jgi:hypothetical protein
MTMATDGAWAGAQRLESWAGEMRVNLIRVVALVAFYGYHLIDVYGISDDPLLRGEYHLVVTIITGAWAAAAFLLHLFLTRRRVSPLLPFVSSGWDLALLTLLLAVTESGPKSPLVVIYFLIIAAAPLRISLPVVYATALGAMGAYLLLLGHYVFVVVGVDDYYRPDFADRIPRTQEVIFLLSLAVAGLLAGQAVRQARRLVRGYPIVVVASKEP